MDVAVDQVWSLKEEPCRGNNWRNQEVIDLLNTIKKNNLMKGCPSGNQLGHLIEPLMGYKRTPFQISGKLKNLRKSYLRCERKGCTPIALKECPYYDLLSEIYRSDDIRSCKTSDIGDASRDVKVCSKKGIALMFDVIKELNLATNLTLQSFSGKAVRLISKMLIAKGVCASVDQVKSTLIGLRKTYIEIRHGKCTKQNSLRFPYYEYLHTLWGSMQLPELSSSVEKLHKPKTETNANKESGDYWSEEETAVLLSSVAALQLKDEAAKNSELAAEKLHAALRDSGFTRTPSQIHEKLDNLRKSFLRAKRAGSHKEAVRQFPVYRLYNSIFGSCSNDILDATDQSLGVEIAQETSEETDDNEPIVFLGKAKHSRSRAWPDDETLLMLSFLEELNLAHHIAHRLSLEVASEVVEPLREHGYVRSAMQIQIKLRNLRKSYYRCIRAGSTETAIAQCPFYHKLDTIFKKPADERKLLTRRKLEPVDANYMKVMESCNDHSYYNASSEEQSPKLPDFPRTCEEEYSNGEVWLPVETICGEEDSTGIVGQEEVASLLGDENALSFEEIDDTEMGPNNDETNGPIESEDLLEESITPVDNDTGQLSCKIDDAKKNTKNTNRSEGEEPGPSREPSKFDPATRRTRKKVANPYSLRMRRDWPIVKSMKIVMAEVLRHDRLLQRQHHIWMARQFELQRKHDRDQREFLMKELRELRKSIALSMPKQQIVNDQPSS